VPQLAHTSLIDGLLPATPPPSPGRARQRRHQLRAPAPPRQAAASRRGQISPG